MINNNLSLRFWKRVNIKGPSECWEWLGVRKTSGYGVFLIDKKHSTPASRMAYILANGSIPEGLTIDHLCFNCSCCNPSHLEAVAMSENLRRAAAIGKGPWQFNLRKTHCKYGHPFTEENTYHPPSGHGRWCRICRTTLKHQQRIRQRTKGLSARGKPLSRAVAPLDY